MQLVLEAYDTLFRVWELAVSFLGLLLTRVATLSPRPLFYWVL